MNPSKTSQGQEILVRRI